jgi:hypothetical protein
VEEPYAKRWVGRGPSRFLMYADESGEERADFRPGYQVPPARHKVSISS